MTQYLTAALEAVESPSSGVPLKVAALKAIRKYVHQIMSFLPTSKHLL